MAAVDGEQGRAARSVVRLLVLVLILSALPLGAQETTPRDTVPLPRDTVVLPADTVPARRDTVGVGVDTAVVRVPPEQVAGDTIPRMGEEEEAPPDSLLPAPNLPVFPRPPATGFALGVWEWDEAELARWHGMSLLELLEQVPGLLSTRGGWHGRPAALAAFGAGGGRTRIFLDGFELDPLESATPDVQYLAVADLRTVRVERTLAETRIELLTFRQPDRRAYSQIEAGTGDFRSRILRGMFSTPVGERSLVTLGLDLTDTDGWQGQQPFSSNTVFARWSYAVGERTGLQFAYRQAGLERTGAPFLMEGDRRDLVLRVRSLPLPGLAVDAVAGRSWRTPGETDSLRVDLASMQGALRARFDHRLAWLGGSTRFRTGDRVGFAAPSLELTAEAGLRPMDWLTATGAVRNARGGDLADTELQAGVRVGPLLGLSLFAQAATGGRGVGLYADSVSTDTIPNPADPEQPLIEQDTTFLFPTMRSGLQGLRAGAEWSGWGVRLGGAYVRHEVDSIAPFGLAFDRAVTPVAVEPATGVEAYFSVPLLYRPLRVQGQYTRWTETGGRPYLPTEHARVALTFSERFYDGNLEPTFRLEAVHRGSALVPDAERTVFGEVSQPYTIYNLFLQIRILDVRAFVIWDNLLNTFQAADLVGPGRAFGGQRAVYGVRWHFFD